MPRRSPPLPALLRRHRGLWVLAVAVLLVKPATRTLCLADGAGFASPATGAAQPVAAGNEDGCLLGEGGNCHCSCAHTAMLPVAPIVAAMAPVPGVTPSPSLPGAVPGAPASLLRPPIA
jgi:hypothetical protein